MAINLTEGAISMIACGENPTDPIVQVMDIKLVNTQNQNSSNERYRMLLSDGSNLQQGMLAIQRNDLVHSQQLQKGSIVKLTQYICNVIQSRMIIIVIDLDVVLAKCDPIGEPKQYPPKTDSETTQFSKPSASVHPPQSQSGTIASNPQSVSGGSLAGVSVPKLNVGGGIRMQAAEMDRTGPHSYVSSFANDPDPGRYNPTSAPAVYRKTESSVGMPRVPLNNHVRQLPPSYHQPPSVSGNRGPVAKNEDPPRIIPIAALNPYQGKWTIKARVTLKGELRHYNNPRGDGKVFSFDLLDFDGGEIRVTCFNAVADQFYNQIEAGKVYLISKGMLKPAQKAFNHLRNDHEIFLETTSRVQPCFEDDSSIPQQKFHFRSISEIEGMENNSVIDLIGVICSISPSFSIMRKNGTETQRRILHLRDMSGRSVELTLWGNFCHIEGQTLQNICDSGVFPVLAVKSCRVNEFNGKAVGTISTSQLFIEPDFPEAQKLKAWFDKGGKNTPHVSISRETIGRTDIRKTISQIKDEKLGTSEKPDWITVSATISYLKSDNFCYTACPSMIGDRQCNKKVTNNGDGKWRCERCDQTVDECDYRYILQFQILDHTGLTWVTAFQECGEEIMGISAKELYYMKFEEQDDERFAEIVRNVLFGKYIFKLKVKEETFSDEQRVKSTVVKADKINFISETTLILGLLVKHKSEDSSSLSLKAENIISNNGFGNVGLKVPAPPIVNSFGSNDTAGREIGLPQAGQYGNQYSGSRLDATGFTGAHISCNSCGGSGHSSTNCPSVMNSQGNSYGGGFGNRTVSAGGGSGECYKCHQHGHWARDCPGMGNVPSAYGGGNVTPGSYGRVPRQHVGGF